MGFVIGDIIVKLILFLICRVYSSKILAAKALSQDHRNDVVVNSVVLISAYLGIYFIFELIFISSFFIIYSYFHEHVFLMKRCKCMGTC